MKLNKKDGFSLLETVITIIVIGLALSAILESFIVGSAQSVSISNQETAANLAKQTMAKLNYCRNGGSVSGVCKAFTTWNNPTSFYTSPQGPNNVSNECYYTVISAKCADFNDNNGSGTIKTGSCGKGYIQATVQTGWFALNSGGTCPAAPANYPYITVSTIFANY